MKKAIEYYVFVTLMMPYYILVTIPVLFFSCRALFVYPLIYIFVKKIPPKTYLKDLWKTIKSHYNQQ